MFQGWRLKLREAEESLKVGRLDDAFAVLQQEGLLEFLPGKKLAERLALQFAERAKRRGAEGDLAGGWRDLDAALLLGRLPACDVARRCLVEGGLEQVETLMRCGDWGSAAARLDELAQRVPAHGEVESGRQLVRSLQAARQLARHGKFSDAAAQLDRAAELRPDLEQVGKLREVCREQQERSRSLTENLFRSLAGEDWGEALRAADELLEIAPEWRVVRSARERAWRKVGARADSTARGMSAARAAVPVEPAESAAGRESAAPRFLLWVDGVGGYLVCLGEDVLIGQHVPGHPSDIPVLGDLSRRHARIRRSGEGYVVEALQLTKVNGRAVHRAAPLADGDELELGGSVRWRFRRPHALSATARLEPLSLHRTQPSADAVLLMAESCVLGPKWQNHVICRDWSGDVVLYRRDAELFCRASAPLEIDGRLCEGRGRLRGNARVVGSDFSLSLEELDKCSSQPLR